MKSQTNKKSERNKRDKWRKKKGKSSLFAGDMILYN
jgi:hypothetical protein